MPTDEALALVNDLVRRQNERDEGWMKFMTSLVSAQTSAIMAALSRGR